MKQTNNPTQPATGKAPLRRILLVDDDPGLFKALDAFSSAKGYQVVRALDGREALTLFRKQSFALVLSGLRLPGMDGLKLLEAIKSLNPRTPVILTSGHGEVETVVKALKSGAENFLAKPVSRDELAKAVKQSLTLACLQVRPGRNLSAMRQATNISAPSQPELIWDLVYQIALSSVAVGFASQDLDNNLKLALAEALTNSMEHGNRWEARKMVTVQAIATRELLEVTISDQGPGFDYGHLQNPTQGDNLLAERGRGIFLMNSVMDEVIFEPPGNRVTLRKMRPSPEDKE